MIYDRLEQVRQRRKRKLKLAATVSVDFVVEDVVGATSNRERNRT